MGQYIASVNLFSYTETTVFNRTIYWGLFLLLIVLGIIETAASQLKNAISMRLSIAVVLILAMTGETYATALAFLFFNLKVFLYSKVDSRWRRVWYYESGDGKNVSLSVK